MTDARAAAQLQLDLLGQLRTAGIRLNVAVPLLSLALGEGIAPETGSGSPRGTARGGNAGAPTTSRQATNLPVPSDARTRTSFLVREPDAVADA
jgi:hypothetical protein